MPPVAATSPGFRTFKESALFGWSPARYLIGIPIGKPVAFAATSVTNPWFWKLLTKDGVKLVSKSKNSSSQFATFFSL